jgi:flagellin
MVSVNTNISALISQANLQKADKMSSSAIAKLSSGNRIIRAADDAAGLAIGTGLKTDVSTLRTALTNTSQANSVLALADGALANIGEILQRQKALASQANSGSLSSQERIFLDQEFQNLVSEIDRIASTTNFNGINLLDGSIAGTSGVVSDTTGSDGYFTASATFDATVAEGAAANDLLTIAGITFATSASAATATTVNQSATAVHIWVDAGNTIDGVAFDTTTGTGFAAAVAYVINNIDTIGLGVTSQSKIDALKGLTATSSGATLTISSRTTGAAGSFVIRKEDAAATEIASITAGSVSVTGATVASVSAVSTNTTDTSGSLGDGYVTASGTIGDAILSALVTTAATDTVTFTGNDLDNNSVITVYGRQFTFKSTVTDADTQIQVGTTNRETLSNLVSFLNNLNDPTVSRFKYEATSETALTMDVTAKTNSANITTIYTITPDASGASTITAGNGGGIDVSTITDNEDFIGQLSGFEATYNGADSVVLSITVGDYTYQGVVDDSTPTGGAVNVRLYSTDRSGLGGYFTLQLANNQGTAVTNQTSADTYAARFNDAFASINFEQNRSVTSFDVSGTDLEGGRVYLKSGDFDDIKVDSVSVTQATSGNSFKGTVQVTLTDGRVFQFQNTGSADRVLYGGREIVLTNTNNSNEEISIILGTRSIDLSSATQAANLQTLLSNGFNTEGGGLDFQVGIASDDVIGLTVTGVDTATLYGGLTLDILTAANAVTAANQLDEAIDTVTALRAEIGSLQSRFDFAAANLQTSIQNTDAARADFLDDDVAGTSTNFAKAQVLLQASISVLAQANQLPQNLLKLIG